MVIIIVIVATLFPSSSFVFVLQTMLRDLHSSITKSIYKEGLKTLKN